MRVQCHMGGGSRTSCLAHPSSIHTPVLSVCESSAPPPPPSEGLWSLRVLSPGQQPGHECTGGRGQLRGLHHNTVASSHGTQQGNHHQLLRRMGRELGCASGTGQGWGMKGNGLVSRHCDMDTAGPHWYLQYPAHTLAPHAARCTLHTAHTRATRCTLDTGQWALGIGHWTLDTPMGSSKRQG